MARAADRNGEVAPNPEAGLALRASARAQEWRNGGGGGGEGGKPACTEAMRLAFDDDIGYRF